LPLPQCCEKDWKSTNHILKKNSVKILQKTRLTTERQETLTSVFHGGIADGPLGTAPMTFQSSLNAFALSLPHLVGNYQGRKVKGQVWIKAIYLGFENIKGQVG
jgi:hypothetical protein